MLAPKLRDAGHNVALSCFFGLEGAYIAWEGMRCYPTDHSRFGAILLGEYAEHHFGGDRKHGIVLTLQDVWPLQQGLGNLQGLRFVCWCPIDHDPAPPLVLKFLRETRAQVIAMSRFGDGALRDAGIEPVGVVPHGVDTKVFAPPASAAVRAQNRMALRLPPDAFVVGMVANNQGFPSRKSFPQVFEAFAEFQRRHDDAFLYLHSDVLGRNHGLNLIELGRANGIPSERLATCNQLKLFIGEITPDLMAATVGCFDVLCMPSMGEGFGIPALEAQACGVPVISTAWTAMPELNGAGWVVDGDRFYDGTQGSFQKLPRVAEILEALEEAYAHRGDEVLAQKARSFAVGYDADTLWENSWVPVLERVQRPREVPPLRMAA